MPTTEASSYFAGTYKRKEYKGASSSIVKGK